MINVNGIEQVARTVQSGLGNESGGMRKVDALDAEAFAQALQAAPAAGADASNTTNPSVKGVEGTATPGSGSLGDTILNGLQKASEDIKGRWSNINAIQENQSKTNSVSDLLKVQMELHHLTLETELTTTAIKKGSTALDQIIHMQ
jgi:hypothetical protein